MSDVVKPNQNIIDKAIQSAGSADAAFHLALLNEVSITDDVEPGTVLKDTSVTNSRVKAEIVRRGIEPATVSTTSEDLPRYFSDEFFEELE